MSDVVGSLEFAAEGVVLVVPVVVMEVGAATAREAAVATASNLLSGTRNFSGSWSGSGLVTSGSVKCIMYPMTKVVLVQPQHTERVGVISDIK